MTISQLDCQLDEKHLLKHSFYQQWSAGELTLDQLKTYACQYYHHVLAFPRYISATHSQCQPLEQRQVLLENLIEEEHGPGNHPDLWLKFSEGLGLTKEQVETTELLPETQTLIDTFLSMGSNSYAEGIGALYAYERQVPKTAASKISGLKQFYSIDDAKTLAFFKVHERADVEHANDTRELIKQLPAQEKKMAYRAAEKVAQTLWNFLSGIERQTLATV